MMMLMMLTMLTPGHGQLIGHRGVISLPVGEVYRDAFTVQASEAAARLALGINDVEERIQETNRFHSRYHLSTLLTFSQSCSRQSGYSLPSYLTQVPVNAIGRPLQDNEIFDVLDSRFLEVPPENKLNVPLDEIEVSVLDSTCPYLTLLTLD